MEAGVGSTIGDKYEILAVVGGGAMGLVYKARHTLMKRTVALKMLHPNMVVDEGTVKRFQKEAEALSCLNHPNILTVFDFGVSKTGQPYLVTDYLEGQTVAELLEQNERADWMRTLRIFTQVCSALAHAHKHGVIHRDIKPSNIMLVNFEEQSDFVKILDFGIAKVVSDVPEGSSSLTRTGEVFGSPLYMSPEQCRGKALDSRSDIYSLGCVMYRTLTGQPALFGQDLVECLYKHVNEEPQPLTLVTPEANIPPELEAVVLKCLAKDPAARYQTMADLKDALNSIIRSAGGAVADDQEASSVMDYSGTPITTPSDAAKDLQAKIEQSGLEQTQPSPDAGKIASGMFKDRKLIIAIVSVIALFIGGQVIWRLVASDPSAHGGGDTTDVATPENTPIPAGADPYETAMDKGSDEFESGYYQESMEWFQRAYEEAKKKNLPKEKVADALHKLIAAATEFGDYDKAAETVAELEAVASVTPQMTKPTTMDAADAFYDRGSLLVYHKDPASVKRAEKLLSAAIDFYKTKPSAGEELMRSLAKMGQIALMEGNLPKAQKYMAQAVTIAKEDPGVSQLELALRLDQLGDTYVLVANTMKKPKDYYENAEDLYKKALKIRKGLLHDDSHPALAQSYKRLGIMFFLRDLYAQSLDQLNRSLAIRQKGNRPLPIAEIQRAISYVYLKQKKFAEAQAMFNQALETAKKAGVADKEVKKWQDGFNGLEAACRKT